MPSLHVEYFYDLPLPSYLAAPIQILSTGRAMCEHDAAFTLHAGKLLRPAVECLEFYGLSPHAHLRLCAFFNRWTRWIGLQSKLRAVAADVERPRVFMSRGETGAAMFSTVRTMRNRQPFVYELHRLWHLQAEENRDPPNKVKRIRALEESAIAGADGLVFLNQPLLDAARERFEFRCPVLVLPSGTDGEAAAGLALQQRDIEVLYAGKFDRRKGLDLLVCAMKFLPEVKVHLVGGTNEQRAALRLKAEHEGVGHRVVMHGFVEPARVGEYFQRARVGVCPLPAGTSSISERFTSPMKILKMMAAGVPVVATDLPSVRELAEHDRTALLVRPNDAEALAGAIRRLLLEPATAERLRAAALKHVRAYSWQNRASRLAEFLRTIAPIATANRGT
jgi:glycosyltransferase involved in cell wall biosynthesis